MTLERILAATSAINMMAVDLQRLNSELVLTGGKVSLTSQNQMALQKTANDLQDIVEELGNYIDGHDAVNETTEKALNALLDIVYERTKE